MPDPTRFANSVSRSDVLVVPGQVNVNKIELVSYTGVSIDLKAVFEQLEIYEDLFSNTLSAELTIIEAVNLLQHIPIVGREFVLIDFNTPGCKSVKCLFSVYKISDRVKYKKETAQMYTLYLCAPEFLQSNKNLISKSYSNMTYHDMVSSIWKTYLSPASNGLTTLKYSKTIGSHSVVLPYWTPLQAINFIAGRSVSVANPFASNYVFYQDLDCFRFVSLDELYAQSSVQKYMYRPANIRNTTNDTRDIERDMKLAIDYSIRPTFDRANGLNQGHFSGTLYTHDITRKRFGKTTYDYINHFMHTNHAGKYPLIPVTDTTFTSESPESAQSVFPYAAFKFDGIEDNEQVALWGLSRKSSFGQLHSTQLEVKVPGDSRRRVGEIVEFEVPSPEETRTANKYYDEYLSGKYLITGINHSITKSDYQLNMELSKDALDKQIPDTKEQIK